jgi:nitroimidazol reductase NimA-like FMN-containing flavoprotein (pyridoxamine 5'-phosphate oxidase superfamily)
MLIHELTYNQCCEVLGRSELGRLACSRLDQPYVVPIHFSFDAERNCVYAFSALGQKVQWMRTNPKVCLEVEEIEHRESWTTVVVFGRYEEIHHAAAEGEARRRAEQLFKERGRWWLPAAARVSGRDAHHDVVVYRIQIEHLTGRRTTRSRE